MSTPTPFLTSIDIMNRALQRCGSDSRIVTLADTTKACDEATFCYDKLRTAELRRNVWRFATRVTALRPLDIGVLRLAPAAWSGTKDYIPGSLVKLNSIIYFSTTNNINSSPDTNPDDWSRYFGPRVVTLYDSKTTYYPGELVYTPADRTYSIYMSLVQSSDDPTDIADYDATVIYSMGDTVIHTAVTYQSNVDLNFANTPVTQTPWSSLTTYGAAAVVIGSDNRRYTSIAGGNLNHNPVTDAGVHWTDGGPEPWIVIPAAQPDQRQGQNWLKLDATVASMPIIYPVGSGPSSQGATSNVYPLPCGFMREAPQDPRAGGLTFLGGPGNNQSSDFIPQGKYIITQQSGVLLFRFVADVAEVGEMDALFCEGLACRVALEICEPMTNSRGKLQDLGSMYKEFMGTARAVNGIETGPTEPPEDEFVAVRR